MIPEFIASPHGRLFVLVYKPEEANANANVKARGIILHAHAFGEEMNKARRATSVAARRLAAEGWIVVQLDLYGCGDSEADFGDATWQIWCENLIFAADWIRKQVGDLPLWLWGTRVGALLSAQVARRVQACGLLWWQPIVSGRQYLTQFLRLKMAGEMMVEPDASGVSEPKVDTKTLRAQLKAGQALEIAGYILSPTLADQLEQAELKLDDGFDIVWLEGSLRDEPALSPASQKCIADLTAAGCRVAAQALKFEPFWQSVEISQVPQLVEATRIAIQRTY